MELDMMANMEVDKVANILADVVAALEVANMVDININP